MKKPNVVFIMTDHQRADSIGMIQDGMEVTPNLNKLAAKGVVFNRAYNACPLCVPARTALATSRYPTNNSIVYNDWEGVKAGNHKPIHEYLYEAGYEMAHVGVDHIRTQPSLKDRVSFKKWVTQKDHMSGLKSKGINSSQSLDHKKEVWEQKDTGERYRKKYSNSRTSVWPHDVKDFRDCYFCEESIDFLKQNHKKPFALFTYFWAPHPPLIVPEPHAYKFDPKRITLPDNVGKISSKEPISRRDGIAAQLAESVSMDEWRKAWAAHLGLVHFVDEQIGHLIDTLETIGELNNTIIVFTADHGDHLGQHSMYQKMEMYEEAIKVPLIIKIPNVQHKQINTVVSHLDVMPTLLDLLEINHDECLDGASVKHLIDYENKEEDRQVFCQYSGNPSLGYVRRAIITSRYKYIYDGSNEQELYDLLMDPHEMFNIAEEKDYEKLVIALHDKCKQWGASHGDWVNFE
ncbi:sulfatase family protein [Vallitalea okinawensis]|uniref:sulfatase family protein n=1 Tax=Vallitalea okinawensis TaxID=2078660 RepID=UPI000CFBE20E|nr:sulfatase-like hydrolase/transferase [Vallitalea okinawensis]